MKAKILTSSTDTGNTTRLREWQQGRDGSGEKGETNKFNTYVKQRAEID